MPSSDSATLTEANKAGQSIFASVTQLEHEADTDSLTASFQGSPIQPYWISESDAVLFYTLTKSACIAGCARGNGFMLARTSGGSSPSSTAAADGGGWSAPCFFTIRLHSVGLSLGRRTLRGFTACMSSDLRLLLGQQGRRGVAGLEVAAGCGRGLQHKSDLLSVCSTGANVGTVGINHTSGALLDVSFSWGEMLVDSDKNGALYGPEVSTLQILSGSGAKPPEELQPLYRTLNSVVSRVERVTPPARVSASLERMTAGYDPERRGVVMPDGSLLLGGGGGGDGRVVQERVDLREPPKDK